MSIIRPAAVAGAFYPGSRAALTAMVDDLLAGVPGDAPSEPVPKALIAPHAGYVYSGSTAALGYRLLAPACTSISRVVLLGPTHRVGISGIALPGADALATPLGQVEVDAELVARVAGVPGVVTRPDVHEQEHSLEVHLPFLQTVLARFTLLPLAVSSASPELVAQVLDLVWGGPETLIVASSDLSHYHPYAEAQRIDRATIDQVLAGGPPLAPYQACGAYPVNGLMLAAPRHGVTPRLLGACNFGDTAGDKGRVVGYGCFAYQEQP